jgi:[CysO sulfur-carrier protein]-S-L-cysteine hydrolase
MQMLFQKGALKTKELVGDVEIFENILAIRRESFGCISPRTLRLCGGMKVFVLSKAKKTFHHGDTESTEKCGSRFSVQWDTMQQVRIARGVVEAMLAHVRSEPQIECCGLLAGRGEPGSAASGADAEETPCEITEILRAENALRSATQYEIAPKELLRMHREMRERGLELMGIYHSHPRGENAPSATDIEKAYYPDVAYVILSPREDAPRPVRAFWIREGVVSELEIEEI